MNSEEIRRCLRKLRDDRGNREYVAVLDGPNHPWVTKYVWISKEICLSPPTQTPKAGDRANMVVENPGVSSVTVNFRLTSREGCINFGDSTLKCIKEIYAPPATENGSVPIPKTEKITEVTSANTMTDILSVETETVHAGRSHDQSRELIYRFHDDSPLG